MDEFIKKLIERLEHKSKTSDYISVHTAIEIVNQVAEEYNDGWIPCERELPPRPKENPLYEGKAVEIYMVCIEDGELPFRAFWNGEFFTQGFRRENVIAWQPLPTPYQPKGE